MANSFGICIVSAENGLRFSYGYGVLAGLTPTAHFKVAEMARGPLGGGYSLPWNLIPLHLGVCRWLQLCSLTGHGGSAAARVFKLFRSEHGEYFNVSSSSEWVQGETGAPNGVTQGQDALSLQNRAFSLAPIRPLTCHRVT